MRWINKKGSVPASIRDYLANQTPVGHGLDYRTFSTTASPQGGSRAHQLLNELTAEQFGLCGYTGVAIDPRRGSRSGAYLSFSAHNEHIKPQSVCRQELIDQGKTPGEDIGDDMSYENIIAALKVEGKGSVRKTDLFGAVHRENDFVPVPPTDRTCEQRYIYNGAMGDVSSTDSESEETIRVLNLNNGVLNEWRRAAVLAFLETITTRSELETIVCKISCPVNGRIPEFAFVIKQVAEQILNS